MTMQQPEVRSEEGFTLIELMMVVLITSILIAIAIPVFNGARRTAQDRQAQSNLRSGLIAQKTHYVDSQSYIDDGTVAGLAALREIESNIVWDTTDATVRGVDVFSITTFVVLDDGVGLQSDSKSGRRFCLADVARNVPDGGTWFASVAGAAPCPAVGAGMAGWSRNASSGWRY